MVVARKAGAWDGRRVLGSHPGAGGPAERDLIQTTASNPKPVAHQQTTREPAPGRGEGQVPGPETPPVPLLLVGWHSVLRPVQGCSHASRSGIAVPPATGPGHRIPAEERRSERSWGWLHSLGAQQLLPTGSPDLPHRRGSSHRPLPPRPRAWPFRGQGYRCSETTPHTWSPPRPPPRAACLWGQQVSRSRNSERVPGKWGPDPLPLWPRAVHSAPQSLALRPSPRPSLCLLHAHCPAPAPTVPKLSREPLCRVWPVQSQLPRPGAPRPPGPRGHLPRPHAPVPPDAVQEGLLQGLGSPALLQRREVHSGRCG